MSFADGRIHFRLSGARDCQEPRGLQWDRYFDPLRYVTLVIQDPCQTGPIDESGEERPSHQGMGPWGEVIGQVGRCRKTDRAVNHANC